MDWEGEKIKLIIIEDKIDNDQIGSEAYANVSGGGGTQMLN